MNSRMEKRGKKGTPSRSIQSFAMDFGSDTSSQRMNSRMGKRGKKVTRSRSSQSFAMDFGSDIPSQPESVETLDQYLEALYKNKVSARETALSSIVRMLRFSHQYQSANDKFFTMLQLFLNSFKRGSLKESCLAVEALGLLAITIGVGDKGHELYRECGPILSEALDSVSQPQKLKLILDCLAMVTYVAGNDLEETERSMQTVWDFLHSKANCEETQSAAVSAWSLLLSTMDTWAISYKRWNGAIPFLMNLLEVDHETVSVTASQALALILEIGNLEKFGGDVSMKEDMDIQKFLKVSETSVKVGGQIITIDTLPQKLQMNFLSRLLGTGLFEHMWDNELLHNMFDFRLEKRQSGTEVYVAEREEVAVNLFVPDVRKEESFQRIYKSPNSIFVKARTQIRNKNQDIKWEEIRSYED